jgi:hypothetical protein
MYKNGNLEGLKLIIAPIIEKTRVYHCAILAINLSSQPIRGFLK